MNDKIMVKKLQQAQKKILLELDRVCKKLNLTYCLAFGSTLGAVRHKGFIPWDDDIDVYMLIDDLEKLQKNSNLFQDRYFLQSHESDLEYGLMITRLRDSNTTLIEKTEVNRNINHGIFIDIYPLFNSPREGIGAKKLLLYSMIYRLMLYGVAPQNRGIFMKLGSLFLLKVVPRKARKRIIKKSYKKMKSMNETGYLTSLYGDEANIRYKKSWIFPVKWVQFEDIIVPIEANTKRYLSLTYGDYMKLPPLDKREVHHNYEFVDFDKSYLEYKGEKYCKEKQA